MFRRKKPVETAPKPMEEAFGIDCDREVAVCGLGNAACTMYSAVFYGGTCGECGEFKQGRFVGNFEMQSQNAEGMTIYPQDQAVTDLIESGTPISPIA